MQSVFSEALFGQVGVDAGESEAPGRCRFGAAVLPAALRVQPVLVLLDAGDMVAQFGDQSTGFALVV
jgi:hypothetical protein